MTQVQSGEPQMPACDFAARVIVADLQKREWRFETLGSDIPARFLGGRGVNDYLLSHYCDSGNREAAPVAFAPGLLTGVIPFGLTCITSCTADRFMQTHLMQGLWGVELKMAGYDHLLLVGKSKSPVILKIHNDQIVFEDAAGMWEKGFDETGNLINSLEENEKFKTLVVFESKSSPPDSVKNPIVSEIFKAKKIKAISVRGTRGLKIYNPQAFKRVVKKLLPLFAGQHERGNRLFSRGEHLPPLQAAESKADGRSALLSREDFTIIQDCLGLKLELDIETLLALVYSITGAQYSPEELSRAAQGIKSVEAVEAWK